ANQFNAKIGEAKEGLEPDDALKNAEKVLREAEELLKNCPKKTGAVVPQTPRDVYVAVDDQPKVNVCVAAGQDPNAAFVSLGINDADPIAATPDGTLVRANGDPKVIEQNAQR